MARWRLNRRRGKRKKKLNLRYLQGERKKNPTPQCAYENALAYEKGKEETLYHHSQGGESA